MGLIILTDSIPKPSHPLHKYTQDKLKALPDVADILPVLILSIPFGASGSGVKSSRKRMLVYDF